MTSRWLVAALVFCVGSAGAASEPKWLQDLRAREGTPTAPQVVRSDDGWFSTKVPAKLASKVVPYDGSYSVGFELAPDIVANCEVIKDGFDLASLVSQTADSTFEELAKEQGKIVAKAVERTDAGHIDGDAYVALDWVYTAETKEGVKVGSLKQVGAIHGEHGVYCFQNDVGYSRSFEALVNAFVGSLEIKEPAVPAAVYEDISVVRLAGLKVGVVTSRIARDSEEGFKAVQVSAMLLPVTPDTLRTQDTYTVQFVGNDGAMINAAQIVATNGEIESNLELKPREEGGWEVSGKHKGKDISGTLEASPMPASLLQQAQNRKALLARPDPVGAESTEWQWLSADPLKLTESKVRIVGAAGDGLFKARESIGSVQADTILERASGMIQQADIAMGPNTMVIERVHARGGL